MAASFGQQSKPRAKATGPDMRPAAICARDMDYAFRQNDTSDGRYVSSMEPGERDALYNHASDCLSHLRADPKILMEAALVLSDLSAYRGFDSGMALGRGATNAICQRDLASERDKAKADYSALVSAYNSLSNQYERLLNVANNLASRPTVVEVEAPRLWPTVGPLTPPPPPPPQPHYFSCVAMALPGNMATIQCQ